MIKNARIIFNTLPMLPSVVLPEEIKNGHHSLYTWILFQFLKEGK